MIRLNLLSALIVCALLLMLRLSSSNAATSSIDTFTTTINFHPTGVSYFDVDSLTANTTSMSVCPSGNCKVNLDNDTIPIMYKFGAEYIVNANLKVSVTKGDTTTSKFYPISVDVTPVSSIEKAGKTTYLLNGTIDFGKGVVNPEMIYSVKNGTLEVDNQHHIVTIYSVLQNNTND
jgi:hypothetical protein